MELISKNELIKSIELGIKQLEESEKDIIPNGLGSPDIVIPCAIMLMKSMIEVVNMCDVIESRPKGKWVPFDIGVFSNAGRECSNCGKRFQLNISYNYCPNCGAEMESE